MRLILFTVAAAADTNVESRPGRYEALDYGESMQQVVKILAFILSQRA